MEGSVNKKLIIINLLKLIFYSFLFYYFIYFLILNNFFIYFLENNNYYYSLEFYLMCILPISYNRDSKGRFKSIKKPLIPLPSKLKLAITGELLGDGHLRFTKKRSKR